MVWSAQEGAKMAKAVSYVGWIVRIELLVWPKPVVDDPIRKDLLARLNQRGYNDVQDLLQGKCFELRIKDRNVREACILTRELAEKLLANEVIEAFGIHKAEIIHQT
jgi:phosphoribosylformylglycinamidine (FGAM) synthase PurS component